MKWNLLILTALILICAMGVIAAADGVGKAPISDYIVPIPDESKIDYVPAPGLPYSPADADTVNMLIGTTHYDYQSNGSIGTRIVKHDCGVHFVWMNGIGAWSGNRWVYYNFMDPSGALQFGETGQAVSALQGAGYCQMDVDASGNALVAYHNTADVRTILSVDAGCGFGLFTHFDPPDQYPARNQFLWPYIAYDNQGRIHIINGEQKTTPGDPGYLSHTISTDMGVSWSEMNIFMDDSYNLSAMIAASPVDDKVALVFTMPAASGGTPGQINQDVGYIESLDGGTWDYQSIVNITQFRVADTFRAYTDVDACYDYDGNLHVIYNCHYYNDSAQTWTPDACYVYHWSDATGISLVYDAYYPSFPGVFNHTASKMSISCDSDNNLYALWTNFNDIDVSAGAYSNGELYLSWSVDGGQSWEAPANVTNTNSEGCLAGDCYSEHWASLAELVDDSLYITYIEDKDAGGIPQTEGTDTENPVRYLTFRKPVTSVDDDYDVPSIFELIGNYPNPFNASTVINFSLERAADVELTVYNILGEVTDHQIQRKLSAGEHQIRWDAKGKPSGVYLYKLSAGGASQTKRMVLLK